MPLRLPITTATLAIGLLVAVVALTGGRSVNVRKGALGVTRHRRPIFRFTVTGGGHVICALYGISQFFGGHVGGEASRYFTVRGPKSGHRR